MLKTGPKWSWPMSLYGPLELERLPLQPKPKKYMLPYVSGSLRMFQPRWLKMCVFYMVGPSVRAIAKNWGHALILTGSLLVELLETGLCPDYKCYSIVRCTRLV